MDPLYKPEGVEARWQKTWEEEGLYHAEPDPSRESYVICVPPPNVTGALHMGHALNGSIQDALIRWHRMRGFNTLWQPGYDHAGIATQAVVERELANQGITRQEIGRDAFVEKVWEWLREYGGVIMGQFRRLGASLDYSRERFTMDDDYIRAVMRFFVHLYERGWIYRANRIINWCPVCATAISDLEVEHVEMDDTLSYVRYPFADGDGYITVATVRPPTILADVAVAVHPDDDRYRDAIGREVVVPVVERRVPVIADERVEPEFGTGALKITPGHDPTDFAIGRDHGLPEPMVIGLDGLMNEQAGELAGLTQDEAERSDPRLAEGARPAREARALPALGRDVRANAQSDRAVDLPAVVVRDGGARATRDRGAAGAARSLPPRVAAPVRDRLARDDPRLVPLAPALVGPPAPDLVLPGRPRQRRRHRARRVRRVRLHGARARPRRARHVVLLGALALRDARLAGPDAGARVVLPGRRERDRARDHPALGEPDDHVRARADGRDPVHRRDHHLHRARPRRAAHVEEPRQRRRPARGGRPLRRGRDQVRPAQDLLHPGRPLQLGRDRGGPQARDQALERVAADPPERGRRRAGRAAAEPRGALDPRAARRGPRRARGRARPLRLRRSDRHALPHHLRRLLRLVRRGDQAAALRRAGPGRERYRARGVGASA